MARNIRWYIPFMSFGGVNCRVNIYDNDWPDYVNPVRLVGGCDPFFFEEDDSPDLLEDVVRFSTGYIRIVERESDLDVDKIYPTSAFDRYIEVLYGSTVVFKGYIQVQDFERSLEPLPKVIELPVISQLGLFDQRKFSNLTCIPPRKISLGELLDLVILNTYERVYVPYNYGYPNPVGLWNKISSLVVWPWNEDFHHSIGNDAPFYKVMDTETYMFVIDAICKAFGWICHETPTALVFTAYDFKGQYCYYPAGHVGDNDYRVIESGLPVTAQPLTDYLTPADNDSSTNMLQPDTGIEISYEGKHGQADFTFDRTTFNNVEKADQDENREQYCFCNLNPVDGLNEITLVAPMSFVSGNTTIQPGKGIVAWNGHEGVLISMDGSWPSGHTLFEIKWFRMKADNLLWNLTFDVMTADYNIGNLTDNQSFVNSYIKTTIDSDDDNFVKVKFYYYYNQNDPDLQQLHSNYLVFVHNISFSPVETSEPYAEYKTRPVDDTDVIPSQNNGRNTVISSSVTMPISFYRLSDHLIGNSVRSTKLTEYPYLFSPRIEMKHRFKLAVSHLPALAHAMMFSFMGERWRIISASFEPWNDVYTLTMQSSEVLEDNNN